MNSDTEDREAGGGQFFSHSIVRVIIAYILQKYIIKS